jgi:hypothetical protein
MIIHGQATTGCTIGAHLLRMIRTIKSRVALGKMAERVVSPKGIRPLRCAIIDDSLMITNRGFILNIRNLLMRSSPLLWHSPRKKSKVIALLFVKRFPLPDLFSACTTRCSSPAGRNRAVSQPCLSLGNHLRSKSGEAS